MKRGGRHSTPQSPLQGFCSWRTVSMGLLGLGLLGTAMGIVFIKHQTRGFHMALQHLQSKRNALHGEWTQLLLEQGTWNTDARVEQVARQHLHLYTHSPHHTLVITP